MKKVIATSMFALFSVVSINANAASICPKYQPYVDGCTFPDKTVLEEIMRGLAKPFRDIWRDQCNTHDRNYQILGKSKQASDSQFYSDMKNRCDSKFNKYLLAPLNQTCRLAAKAVYEVVKDVNTSEYYLPNQRAINYYTDNLSNQVNNGQCAMTPEYAGVYDPTLISYVISRFSSINGRKPSAYERLTLLKLYNPDSGLQQWYNDVSTFSYALGSNTAPEIRIANANTFSTFGKDASGSVGSGLSYSWELTLGNQTGATYTKRFMNMYNETYHVKGTLIVTDSNGSKDLQIIDENYLSRGICAPHAGMHCL